MKHVQYEYFVLVVNIQCKCCNVTQQSTLGVHVFLRNCIWYVVVLYVKVLFKIQDQGTIYSFAQKVSAALDSCFASLFDLWQHV